MNQFDAATFADALHRVLRLYRNPDGSRYVAPRAVHEGKRALAGFNDWQRLWREDIPALLQSAVQDRAASKTSLGWLAVLMQYTEQIEHHTRGPYPPHCSRCDQRFALNFLPEVICVTQDIAEPDVDLATARIDGMCRACISLES
jgi:hypothetical protein